MSESSEVLEARDDHFPVNHGGIMHMAIISGQQGRNSWPVRVIIGGQFAA